MDWVLAIDFGTSVTAAACLEVDDGSRVVPVLVEVDGHWRVPSAVVRTVSGEWSVGQRALRSAVTRLAAFEPNPKRRLGEQQIDLDGPVSITEPVAALLRTMYDEACRVREGRAPVAVCLTHPAQWASRRQEVLRACAQRAGLHNVQLLAEPVAAAHWYAASSRRLGPGDRIAVYDLGGGTFDVAIIEAQANGDLKRIGRPYGIDRLGGVDFDHALLTLVGRTASRRDGALWQSLTDPGDVNARRRSRELAEEVTRQKETLSTHTQVPVWVPGTDVEVEVTREEFTRAIGGDLERTVTLLGQAITDAGLRPDQITGVYLVGGSSRIPAVEQLITQRLDVPTLTLDEPKQVVALGAVSYLAQQVRSGQHASNAATPTPDDGSGSSERTVETAPVTTRLCRLVLGDYLAGARTVMGPLPPNMGWATSASLTVKHDDDDFVAEVTQRPGRYTASGDPNESLARRLSSLPSTLSIESTRRTMFGMDVGYHAVRDSDGSQHRVVLAQTENWHVVLDAWAESGRPMTAATAWLEQVGQGELITDPGWRIGVPVVNDSQLTCGEALSGRVTFYGAPTKYVDMFTTERFTGDVGDFGVSLEEKRRANGTVTVLARGAVVFEGRPAFAVSLLSGLPGMKQAVETHVFCDLDGVLIESRYVENFREKRKRNRLDEARATANGQLNLIRVLCHADL